MLGSCPTFFSFPPGTRWYENETDELVLVRRRVYISWNGNATQKSLSVSLLNKRRSSHRPSLMSFFSIFRLVFFSHFCFDAFSPHLKKGASVGVERARVNAGKTVRQKKRRVGRRRAKEAEKSMTWVMSVSGTVAGSPPMMRWCL